jgi:hypothetical protein
MRFPRTPFMERTFDLAERRNLPVKLIPYIMQMAPPSPHTFSFFNNARVNNQDSNVTGDPFNVHAYVNDPNLRTPSGVSRHVATVIQPFRDLFRAPAGAQPDIATGMENLFTATNIFSMRSYMFQLGMDARAISWCETLDKTTGLYDRALTESTYLDNFCRFMTVTRLVQSLLGAWPSIGPLSPFLGLSHRIKIQIRAGIASSTC